MHNDNTITLCSLAEPSLTRYTIENAIGWTAHMEYDQIIKCQDDGKPVLNIKQKQEEFIRRIKESGLQFRVKRIFHVIHPTLSWKHECKFTDNAMRYLKLFVKNDIPFTLLPSEGMTDDLERLQQNSPPLYDKIIGHLEAKENSSAGTQEYIDADKHCLLPSNLDETAKKIVIQLHPSMEYSTVLGERLTMGELIELIKAGAEWMAGQGVNLSHLIAWYIQSVDAHDPVWTKEHLEELVKDYIVIPKN